MRRIPVPLDVRAVVAVLALAACGGGGDGGTAPPSVASVAIIAPAVAPTLQTLTRTVQFTAVARDADNAPLVSATITWGSTSALVATVSAAGLVTAIGNGTTQITASSGGVTSSAVTVTVAQVAAAVNTTPAAIAFGAIGSTRLLTAVVVDSSSAPVAGAPAVAWTRAGTGATASVSAGGLATALAVGATDTAVATASGKEGRAPISVTQVIASVLVSPAPTDTLRTTGRTKQYTAVVSDSQSTTIPSAVVSWTSSIPGIATVGAGTGLAAAVADGSTSIIATSGTIAGQRTLVVERYADVFLLSPGAATITTPLGTQIFTGTAQDSVSTNLPIAWVSRSPLVASISAASGPQVTATAASNGTTRIVMTAGTRKDSATVTVSGQTTAPLTATVIVGDFFFESQRNGTKDDAIDTVAVGGTVTWNWTGAAPHSVQSTGSPSFSNSTVKTSGNYSFLFNSAGAYTYLCGIHASMTGRVVVR